MLITSLKGHLAAAALAVVAWLAIGTTVSAMEMTGAGATFPYPVLQNGPRPIRQDRRTVNYQSIGSGGGIKQIEAKTVDFGASDMPLMPEDLEAHGLVQWPLIMGGVVPVVNLEGHRAGEMKLTGTVLAESSSVRSPMERSGHRQA